MTEASCLAIVDGQDIFNVRKYLKDLGFGNAKVNYEFLMELLEKTIVEKLSFRKPDKVIVICSMTGSEPQTRFLETLKTVGYIVHAIDHWKTFIPFAGLGSIPDFGKSNSVSTLCSSIGYMIGVLSCRPNPQVIVVSGSFALFEPLADFTENYNGRAAIVFFQRFLDPRWNIVGFNEKLQFYDLELHAKELLGIGLDKIAERKTIGI